MNSKKRVYIAYTGGTIGMKRGPHGFGPVPGFFPQTISQLPELQMDGMPEIEVYEYPQLIDSSNMSPSDWFGIADDIRRRYDHFDGFVILHGTDTMAYTTSALSFMLQDLAKPVIVTGSQIPFCELRSDARDNLITSIIIAGNYAIPEVCLYFHNHLYRGNRVQKIDANGFDAFGSPNFPSLAEVGATIQVKEHLLQKLPGQYLKVQELSPPPIGTINIFPGLSANILRNFLAPPLEGLILQTYGMGNAPCNDQEFLNVLKEADRRGVIIVNCTQCYRGSVNMQGYETGQLLAQQGVISGFDMTPEAALTKLYYLFSLGLPKPVIKEKMQANLRGELSNETATRSATD